MTGYRIGVVNYKNFGPFENVTHDFDTPGLTVIEGSIEGKRGCNSNGAGKSFLFDGPAWALFGRCIREKYKGNEVIHLASKAGCSVEVNLVGGPAAIKIVRYRKHPMNGDKVLLYVNGKNKTRGTNGATTLAIAKLVGMDFTSFCNSVAFGVHEDIKSFFAATDSDRKKVLERILGLELYSSAEKLARKMLTEVSEDVERLTLQRTRLQGTIGERRQLLNSFLTAEKEDDVEFKAKRLRLEAKRLRKTATKHVKQRDTLTDVHDLNVAAHDEAVVQYDEAHEEYDDALLALSQKRMRVKQERAGLKTKQSAALKKKAKFDKLAGKNCPECEQKLAKKRADECGKRYVEEIEVAEKSVKCCVTKLAGIDKEEGKLVEPEAPEKPPEIAELYAKIEGVKEELNAANNDAKVAEARASEMEEAQQRVDTQVTELTTAVESAEESLQAVDEEYAEVKKRSDDLEFWVEGFGNRGLKSFLIEAEIPEINRLATTYAQELLGIGAVVKLNATKALKTKDVVRENLTVEGSIPQCTESYAGASRGQKKRMDLSLLLAFRELVSTRQVRAFSQLFMDEIFDGLDPAGADTICELLQGIAAVCPVSLITHDKRIKPVADRVVLVCHKEGRAIIEGAAKGVTKNLGVKRKGVTKKAKKKVVKKVTKKVKRKKKPQKASKR